MKAAINRLPSFLKGKQGVLQYNLNEVTTEHPNMKTVIENCLRKNGVAEVDIDYDDKDYLLRILVVGNEVCAVEIGCEGDDWTLKMKENK